MQFFGVGSLDELVGQRVEMILLGEGPGAAALTGTVGRREGVAYIDFLPLRPGRYVAPVPEDAIVAAASAAEAPAPFAMVLPRGSEAGLLLAELIRRGDIARN